MPSNIVSNPHLAGLASLHRRGGEGFHKVAKIHYIKKLLHISVLCFLCIFYALCLCLLLASPVLFCIQFPIFLFPGLTLFSEHSLSSISLAQPPPASISCLSHAVAHLLLVPACLATYQVVSCFLCLTIYYCTWPAVFSSTQSPGLVPPYPMIPMPSHAWLAKGTGVSNNIHVA
jgi:hypothetical protein